MEPGRVPATTTTQHHEIARFLGTRFWYLRPASPVLPGRKGCDSRFQKVEEEGEKLVGLVLSRAAPSTEYQVRLDRHEHLILSRGTAGNINNIDNAKLANSFGGIQSNLNHMI